MGRTLYLNESSGASVRRDGPSLWIHYPDRSGQRIPVLEVSKVVIIGNVKIDSASITLFTENNIPVVLMNYSGKEHAVAIPYNHKIARHHKEQQIFYANIQNTFRYFNWAKSKRSLIQVKMLKRLLKRLQGKVRMGIGYGNYELIISQMIPPERNINKTVKDIIQNLFRGMITERLLSADLDPHLGVINRWHNYGLVLDICYILGAEIDMQTIQFFNSKTDLCNLINREGNYNYSLTEEGMKSIILRFENRQDTLSDMTNGIIDDIFTLMRELSL